MLGCKFSRSNLLPLMSLILFWSGADSARALPVYYGSDVQSISIVHGNPTVLRFDEPVKTLSNATKFEIVPANDTSPDYSVLSIKARKSNSKDEINFILANGAVVRVLVTTVPKHIPEKTHNLYDFTPRKEEIQRELEENTSVSQMQLLKAMIREDQVTGYASRNISRAVVSGDANLKIELIKLYTGPKFNGYVFRITNTAPSKDFQIKLENLSIGYPNTALLSQVDTANLKNSSTKQNTTLLRVVASATATYYNINLPFKELKTK